MSKSLEIAKTIIKRANELGWTIKIHNNIFTINKSIVKNDLDAFSKADQEYFSILSLLPITSSGSIWGTDGSGVGALYAMNHGIFTMNKSGGSKRVLNALNELIH